MIRVLAVLLLVCCALTSQAQVRERRAALSEMYRVEEFRIFYSRLGSDGLPNLVDANGNGTPDYVERIARELVSARAFYRDQLRLMHPMSSLRYRSQVEFIDVNLLAFPLKPGGSRYGTAYDEVSSVARARDSGRKVRVLFVDISNDLPAVNGTVAHELFHLHQYGYTFFRNDWYTEGTARWAERLVNARSAKPGRLPASQAEVRELFTQAYEAASFWGRLSEQLDPDGRKFIRTFLEELDRADDRVGVGMSGKWKEADQKSSANDIHIWRALRRTLARPAFAPFWDQDLRDLMAIEP